MVLNPHFDVVNGGSELLHLKAGSIIDAFQIPDGPGGILDMPDAFVQVFVQVFHLCIEIGIELADALLY